MRSALLSLFLLASAARADGLHVLEFYTSQGCASCPAAEEVAGRLAARPDLLVVAFHVRWWDYLGWADPLGLTVSGQRQRGYAKQWRLPHVFTPQVVVQGRSYGTGSQEQEVASLLGKAPPVPRIAVRREPDGLVAEIPPLAMPHAAELWLLALDARVRTKVERGENAAKTLDSVNVVRAALPVASVTATPARLLLPVTVLAGHDTAAVLLQLPGPGAILAAGSTTLQ